MIADEQSKTNTDYPTTEAAVADVPEGMRAAALSQAANFLANPSVQSSSDIIGKQNFLLKKGLTIEELNEAFKRAGLEAPTVQSELVAAPVPAPAEAPKQDHPYSNKFFDVLQVLRTCRPCVLTLIINLTCSNTRRCKKARLCPESVTSTTPPAKA